MVFFTSASFLKPFFLLNLRHNTASRETNERAIYLTTKPSGGSTHTATKSSMTQNHTNGEQANNKAATGHLPRSLTTEEVIYTATAVTTEEVIGTTTAVNAESSTDNTIKTNERRKRRDICTLHFVFVYKYRV